MLSDVKTAFTCTPALKLCLTESESEESERFHLFYVIEKGLSADLLQNIALSFQGPHKGKGWGGGGALAPPPPTPDFFCKNKNKLNKKMSTKVTEWKIAKNR